MSTYAYHKIALDRAHLNEDSVSASLEEVSKRFQLPVTPASYGSGFANVISLPCLIIMKITVE